MNICTTALDGTLREIDPRSALGGASFLTDKLSKVEENEHPGMLRAIRELEFIATPAAHFDMAYFTPRGYEPGWVADP
ncbi:MAG TPA: hypothetical protein VFP92_00920 [Rhodanobacteraceae bacterium]|nr:hypothetical protein [Rhodanobacteraceae bacterium]